MAVGGLIAIVAGLLAAPCLLGCGGTQFPPAAEPAASPAPSHPAAGTSFRVGAEPEGLVVDGRTGLAAVITRDPSQLRVVDLDRRRVVARASLPSTGRHLALAGPGGRVLVPAEQSDELVEVSLPGAGERSIAVGDHPHDAVAASGRIFVGDEFGNAISVIEDGRVVATLDAPVQPGGLAAAGRYVVCVAVAERRLAVYDSRTLELVGEIGAGSGPTHVVAVGSRAWVADTDGDAIRAYAIGPAPRLIASVPAPDAPYGMALDPRRRRLWVTLTAANEVVEYDVSGAVPREVERRPTLRQPNSVAVDPRTGTVVLAGRDSGRLELIGAGR